MPPVAIDLTLTVLILGMTYALSSEGAWGAALMALNVMFAGIIAFNFYEPLAKVVSDNASAMAGWADMLCLVGLFLVSLIVLRVITDLIAPGMVRLPTPIYHLGRLMFGLGGAVMMTAILLCALETAPVHRKIFGVINYNTKPPWGLGFDRAWLAFFQHTTGYTFPSYDEELPEDPLGEFGHAKVFDRKGAWLIDHQNARPYHPEASFDTVPEQEAAAPPPAAPPANPGGG